MQSYLGGTDITLTIPLIDQNGAVVVPTAVSYRLIDADELELVAKTPVPGYVAPATTVSLPVAAALNDLGMAARALRVVELYITTAAGIVTLTHEYVIETLAVVSVGVNSFQTLPAATLVGFELPNVSAWMLASREQRQNALMAAYRNFGKLSLRYIGVDGGYDQSRMVAPADYAYYDITMLGAQNFATLPLEYRQALCRAQVYEADFLLGGDEVGDIRRSGLMSATVGESSQFFRPGKVYEGPVCKRALKELSRYIVHGKKIGRA